MSVMTPATLRRLRIIQYVFSALNQLSFSLLSGSIITLYALRLGASGTVIGALNAFGFLTFFFMPLGRALISKWRIIDAFAWGWILRYVLMVPVLFTPLLVARSRPDVALGLVVAAVAGFNVFRGIGLIGNNPVLAMLGGDRDRGAFLSNLQIINALVSIVTYLAVAIVLGSDAKPVLYALFMGIGIVVGILGSLLLFKFPEPEEYRPAKASTLGAAVREAVRAKPIRDYFFVFAIVSFVAATARAFLVVYARAVYSAGDDDVMLYTLVTNLGSVAMGVLTRKLVDRIGAKPLYGIFTAVSALSLVPVLVSPALASSTWITVFLVAINFASGFGLAGEENAAQTYYFALIPTNRTLDLAIVYYLIYGFAGALGATLGGVALDGLSAVGFSAAASYRILFSGLFALLCLAIIRTPALVRLGSTSIRESLGILFSLRDMRAIGLLERLDRSNRPEDETRIIREIGESGRPVAQRELLPYLRSPRFDVRMEALLALENIRSLNRTSLQAVAETMREHPFTTAYLSARILGKNGYRESIPLLREALGSKDYMLKGAAMVALAQLKDTPTVPLIEEIVASAENPCIIVQGAYALEILGSATSVPPLVEVLRKEGTPDIVRDEAVLSLAAILGVFDRFYPMYREWVAAPERGLAMLRDALDERSGGLPASDIEERRSAIRDLLLDEPEGSAVARVFLKSRSLDPRAAAVLAEAAVDTSLCRHRGFRFLLAVQATLAN
jgi:HEAT repeat protein